VPACWVDRCDPVDPRSPDRLASRHRDRCGSSPWPVGAGRIGAGRAYVGRGCRVRAGRRRHAGQLIPGSRLPSRWGTAEAPVAPAGAPRRASGDCPAGGQRSARARRRPRCIGEEPLGEARQPYGLGLAVRAVPRRRSRRPAMRTQPPPGGAALQVRASRPADSPPRRHQSTGRCGGRHGRAPLGFALHGLGDVEAPTEPTGPTGTRSQRPPRLRVAAVGPARSVAPGEAPSTTGGSSAAARAPGTASTTTDAYSPASAGQVARANKPQRPSTASARRAAAGAARAENGGTHAAREGQAARELGRLGGSWRPGLPSRLSYFSERSGPPSRRGAPGGRTGRRGSAIPTRCCTPAGTRNARPYAATGAARAPAGARDSPASIVSPPLEPI
jgi:hypothetical protein